MTDEIITRKLAELENRVHILEEEIVALGGKRHQFDRNDEDMRSL